MGLETINSSSRPSALNIHWPVGATDATLFGAIHIRNLKVVMKNFQIDVEGYREWFDNMIETNEDDGLEYFSGAADATLIDGVNASAYLQVGNKTGAFLATQLPLASTTQAGIVQLVTDTDLDSEQYAVTSKAVWEVNETAGADVETNDAVSWTRMQPDGTSPETYWYFPSAVLGWIEAGYDLEVWYVTQGGDDTDDTYRYSRRYMVYAREWVIPNPDRDDRASKIKAPRGKWKHNAYAGYYYVADTLLQGRQSTDTSSSNLYEVLANGFSTDNEVIIEAYCRRVLVGE